MARKEYEEYKYIDAEGVYTNLKTGTLINKLEIEDKSELRELEYRIVSDKLLELFITPIEVYNTEDICKIHKFLFKDLYYWAGEVRKVNISKNGKPFIPIQSFPTAREYLDDLIESYNRQAQSKEDLVYYLSEILDALNYFHPFREGNGRVQREVVRVLALSKGFKCLININTSDEIYNLYMDGTVYGDKEKLKLLFLKILEKI